MVSAGPLDMVMYVKEGCLTIVYVVSADSLYILDKGVESEGMRLI
jgi:hypothetical protein